MADNDLLITISGAALSLLFYEYVRSHGDQMGFLLGENLEFVVKTYTDAEKQIETVKRHNNIETVVTCPLPDLLHDSIGRINKEKLKDLMRNKSKQVIGWFRFRRNTNLMLTMRDRILHKEFASHFSGGNGCAEEFFVTCLLSSSITSDKGTHKFKHVFLRRARGIFEPVPLKIINLGNDLAILDGSDYKPAPSNKNLSNTPDVFSKLVESLSLDLARTSGVDSAITIQKAAEQYLDKLIPELCESDHRVAELEKQIKEFDLHRRAKLNGSTNNINKKCEAGKDGACRKSQKVDVSPSRIDVSENDCEERKMLNDNSTATSQTLAAHINRNTSASLEKSINQTKSRKPPVDAVNSTDLSRQGSPPMKPSTLNRRYSNMESEIVKESICKGETHEIGVGRGRGKYIQETQLEPKKGRRTAGPMGSRSTSVHCTERTSHSQVSQQEPSEANCVQNTSSQVSYSQIAQKKTDITRKSDAADNY